MISIVLFIVACLVWQAIKNAIRGPRKLNIKMVQVQKAECGCEVSQNRVVTACSAHKILLEVE